MAGRFFLHVGSIREEFRMQVRTSSVAAVSAVAVLGGWLLVAGNRASAGQLPLEPPKERGDSITGAFEGWYKNQDGTFTLLVGYFNRNAKQTIEIPVGPNNRIDPGGPDQGQPTYFAPRRAWGVFSIVVPKDFGTKKLSWTIVANGESTSIPLSLHPAWEISPFKDPAMGNTPPTIRFSPSGPVLTGPPRGVAASYTGIVGQPLDFEFWAADAGNTVSQAGGAGFGRGGPGISISLHKFRGPGDVKFTRDRPEISKEDGRVSAQATFSAAGDYIVRVQANDASGEGGGGFQCCWTNVHVKVTVR
jgi:hypothetical protein